MFKISCFRFLTVLYYLNDVPRGGETAFPVADEEYFNETVRITNLDRAYVPGGGESRNYGEGGVMLNRGVLFVPVQSANVYNAGPSVRKMQIMPEVAACSIEYSTNSCVFSETASYSLFQNLLILSRVVVLQPFILLLRHKFLWTYK